MQNADIRIVHSLAVFETGDCNPDDTATCARPGLPELFARDNSRGENEEEQAQRGVLPLSVHDDRRSDWSQSLFSPRGWPPQVDVRSRFLVWQLEEP